MPAFILEELAALHWETVNQVRAAANVSRFALGQVDPTAALGGTAANLPHFLSSQDLVKPKLSDDERHFCLSSQAFRPTTPRHGSSDGIPAGTTTV